MAVPAGAWRSSTEYAGVVSSTPSAVVDWLMWSAWLMSRETTMKVVRSS